MLSGDPTYVSLVTVNEERLQNVQELAGIWGDVQSDIRQFGGKLLDTYCMLGRYDFLVVFEAPGRGAALQTAVAVERYGLDVETMQAIHIENFGRLVQDV